MTLQLVNPPSDANPASRLQLASSATLAETGLSEDLIVQLVVKLLHFNADCTGVEVANRLGLEFSVVEPVLEQLKRSLVCEVVGGPLVGLEAAGPRAKVRVFTLTLSPHCHP